MHVNWYNKESWKVKTQVKSFYPELPELNLIILFYFSPKYKLEMHCAASSDSVQNSFQQCVFNIKLTMFASNKMFINESYLSYKEQQREFVIQRCTLGVTGGKVHAEVSVEKGKE